MESAKHCLLSRYQSLMHVFAVRRPSVEVIKIARARGGPWAPRGAIASAALRAAASWRRGPAAAGGGRRQRRVVHAERALLLVRGSVPGPRGATVLIRDAVKGAR